MYYKYAVHHLDNYCTTTKLVNTDVIPGLKLTINIFPERILFLTRPAFPDTRSHLAKVPEKTELEQ